MTGKPDFPWSLIRDAERYPSTSSKPVVYALEAVFDQLQRVIDAINHQGNK